MKHRYLPVVGGLLLAALSLWAGPAAAQALRLDPTFQPPQILTTSGNRGTVRAVVRQPDGKYLIGGAFGSINGVRVRNLARLHADGTLDATFDGAASGQVHALALQPDGNILVGGAFDSLGGAARPRLGRLLPGGALDAGFVPTITPISPTVTGTITQVAALPGGDVLALRPTGASQYSPPSGLFRFGGTTGQPVTGFQQAVEVLCFAVQPDGKILIGGGGGSYVLMYLLARLLPTGSLDPSFAPTTTYFTAATLQVAQHTDGTVYSNSQYDGLRGHSGPSTGQLSGFALQPNGRILLLPWTTADNQPLTARLLASGQPDASYQAANGPRSTTGGSVLATLVQPDGGIVYAGDYPLAGTTTVWGLARFLDANVLKTRVAAEAAVAVWPNPATDVLHLRFAPGSQPQTVSLLDNLGRVVRRQPVSSAETTLAVRDLPAGAYVLRVDDTQARPLTQRVLLTR